MVNLNLDKIVLDFCTYFGIEPKQLTFSFDGKIPVAQLNRKNETVRGLRNIVSEVSKPSDPEISALQDQWVEYALTHMGNLEGTSSQILKDINEYIVDKVYFVGNELGPVDILMYYVLYKTVSNLTHQEKENYLHAGRWLDNIQQNPKARLWRSLIPFSRVCLYVG